MTTGEMATVEPSMEALMTDADETNESTKLERDLRLSLFREGLRCGFMEMTGAGDGMKKPMDDADFACGYSNGSTMAERALETYRLALMGGIK